MPCEDRCLGVAGCDNGATILILGDLLTHAPHRRPPGALGQGARVIGTDGIMELWTGRPPHDEIPSDGPMNQPEGPSAGYNYEFGVVRYLNGSSGGWEDVEAAWHDCWAHQCQEAIDWSRARCRTSRSAAPSTGVRCRR